MGNPIRVSPNGGGPPHFSIVSIWLQSINNQMASLEIQFGKEKQSNYDNIKIHMLPYNNCHMFCCSHRSTSTHRSYLKVEVDLLKDQLRFHFNLLQPILSYHIFVQASLFKMTALVEKVETEMEDITHQISQEERTLESGSSKLDVLKKYGSRF